MSAIGLTPPRSEDIYCLARKALVMRLCLCELLLAPPLFVAFLVLSLLAPESARAEIRPEFLMYSDPEVQLPGTVKSYSPRLKTLWLDALSRPEHDMQRQAAETIGKAHQMGVPDLEEAIPQLEKLLIADGSHPATRFAAARALIALKSQHSAPRFFDAAQRHESELRQLVEPVLAEWDFAPVRAVWLARLHDRSGRQRDTALALRGLAHVREVKAFDIVRQMTLDRQLRPDLRLEAAVTAGLLVERDLEPDAERLAKSAVARTSNTAQSLLIVDRLCAIRLLARHVSDKARTLLVELAQDAEPSIAAAALARLNEIDPSLVLPLAEVAMSRPDPQVRRHAAESFIQRPTPDRMPSLARLLDDVHPKVRGEIREALFRLAAAPELSDPIRVAASHELSRDSWRGHEQAALLLAALDHKPAAGRLVELLESPRPEVMIATAWGLRRLEVAETLPAMLDKARRQTVIRKQANPAGLDEQVAHLCEGFARMKYHAAEPLLREYIPLKMAMGIHSRGAAIWSLGWLHEGKPEGDLPGLFIDRVLDPATMPPELDLVREFSAVSLARMKAIGQIEALQGFAKPRGGYERTGLVARWSLTQLTGEQFPVEPPQVISPGVWFLEPVGAEK